MTSGKIKMKELNCVDEVSTAVKKCAYSMNICCGRFYKLNYKLGYKHIEGKD